jgi:hypothetical protein
MENGRRVVYTPSQGIITMNDRPFRVNPKSDGKSIFYAGDDSKNQTEVLFLIVILVNLPIPNTIFWYVRQDFDHAYY